MSTLELAIRIPLPNSTSTVHLENEGRVSADSYAYAASATPITPHHTEPAVDQFDIDDNPNAPRLNESSLPPMDKGFQAWSFLTAAFLIESILWGFPMAFGVFLDNYLSDPTYTSQPNAGFLLPLIGPVSTGIMYCSGPFLNPFFSRYPYHRRTAMRLGSVICAASLFSASWTESVLLLLTFQGILYAIGGALIYHPTISYLPTWFLNRRGLANGVVFAGTAVGGVVLPFILPPLLEKYGPRVTLRWLGVAVGIGLLPSIFWIKPRVPERTLRPSTVGPSPRGSSGTSRSENFITRIKQSIKESFTWWFGHGTILILLLGNTVQGFGYFPPMVWVPTYASSALNLNKSESAIVLAMLNAGSLLGRLTLGYLSDKWDPWVLALSSLIPASLSVFILWGVFSSNLAGLLAFGLVYGIFAGGWGTLWTGLIRRGVNGEDGNGNGNGKEDDPTLIANLFGYLMLSRGLGNILSTPISSVLFPSSPVSSVPANPATLQSNSALVNSTEFGDKFETLLTLTTGFSAQDHHFQNLIIYVGTCFALAAGVMVIGWGHEVYTFKRRRRVGWN